jgi:transcriptional regulator with XRE-family HTH domain
MPVGEQQAEPTALGTQIADARRAKGMTQQRLADLLGVDRKTVNRWETGRTNGLGPNVARLGEVLGWSAEGVAAVLRGQVHGDLHSGNVLVVPSMVSMIEAAAAEFTDEPDPLEAKLERVQLLNQTLNPTDRRRLRAQVDMLLEWMHSRGGMPEPTAEEREVLEHVQRASRAHNEAMRGRLDRQPAEPRREPAMRKKPTDRQVPGPVT